MTPREVTAEIRDILAYIGLDCNPDFAVRTKRVLTKDGAELRTVIHGVDSTVAAFALGSYVGRASGTFSRRVFDGLLEITQKEQK